MKVAEILDPYSVAVTRRDGGLLIEDGDCVGLAKMVRPVKDPDTGEVLGQLSELPLRVTEVYENFFIAKTTRYVKDRDDEAAMVAVCVGDEIVRIA